MIHTEKESAIYLWSVVTALVAFCIGYIHHRWFFPLYFHGDAASMHVLAEAILDEGSLLPTDFSYGNQLVFLRSSPFIALTLLVGFTGYKAFILGSSLSITFWGVVLYLFLSAYFKSRRKGFLFSILLLLPLGPWDFDLILGQQSHLSNAILALGFVVSICLYVLDKSKLFLVVACVYLFVRKIYPYSWLTRPSWSCVEDDVLYYLKDGPVDKVIKEKLINVGGEQVQDGNGYSLWKGPRVWPFPSNTGCYESSLIYEGESLSNLPATVGILQKRTKETDGRAGFLVFGPYSPLKAGEYRLNVYGFSNLAASAYVDVVSGKGTIVHAHFDVEKNAKGLLVDNADVHLPNSASDIEVRVWVGENDSIDLFGYSLKPYLKN